MRMNFLNDALGRVPEYRAIENASFTPGGSARSILSSVSGGKDFGFSISGRRFFCRIRPPDGSSANSFPG